MKKNHITSALLVLTLITAAAPLQAQGSTPKKRFHESLDRFKSCIKGKCTKWELAKAGRDLIIAITALSATSIAASYAVGKGLEKGVEAGYHRLSPRFRGPAYRAGLKMQQPAKAIGRFGAEARKRITDPLGIEEEYKAGFNK